MNPSLRSECLATLSRGVDVLVIGGGITGAGVALDAATRGYRVGLVEQADFASGTSSRSTKLIHGGIRYLPQGHISLVREGLHERTLLLKLAAHLVHPLAFVIPLYAAASRPLGVRIPAWARPFAPLGIRAGLFAYDLFAGSPHLHHRALSGAEVERTSPDLRTENLRAALVYYDARTDDVRLTHSVLATARMHGVVTVNHAPVTRLLQNGERITGARVEDGLSGRALDIPARFVVNATGIWGEHVAALDREPAFRIRYSKGAHLVLRDGAVRCQTAIVIPETDDGRLAFIVPWAGRPLLGTTDDAYDGDLSHPAVSSTDVTYLLDHANRYVKRPLRREDITATFAGIRPLVAAASGPTAALSRDHVVATSPGGLVSIIGGKLTSFRRMAEDTVDTIVKRDGGSRPCRTATLRLSGAAGLDGARADLAASGLAPDQQTHLLEWYGDASRDLLALVRTESALGERLAPGLPMIAAEVVHACRAEEAASLTDCMFLRTRLATIDWDAADEAVEKVTSLMARELQWDPHEALRQRDDYETRRDRERAWAAPLKVS